MKRFLLFFLFLTCIFGVFNKPALADQADERFGVCDLCSYCPDNSPPSNWENCRQCLYPQASSDPQTKATLLVNPDTNTQPTPFPGRAYTMLGCIRSDLGSFTQEGAASSVIQTLLNMIFAFGGGLAFLFLIYGSFLILTSQAEPEKLNHGKRVVYGAVIGIVFALFSVFLVNFLASGVLKLPGFQDPSQ